MKADATLFPYRVKPENLLPALAELLEERPELAHKTGWRGDDRPSLAGLLVESVLWGA